MLPLLFGGALRLGGGFAVLGLALSPCSATAAAAAVSAIFRSSPIRRHRAPVPIARARTWCPSGQGRRPGRPLHESAWASDGLGRIGALQTRWAAGGDEQRLHLDQRVVRCQTEPLNRRAGHVADCVLGLQRQGTACGNLGFRHQGLVNQHVTDGADVRIGVDLGVNRLLR